MHSLSISVIFVSIMSSADEYTNPVMSSKLTSPSQMSSDLGDAGLAAAAAGCLRRLARCCCCPSTKVEDTRRATTKKPTRKTFMLTDFSMRKFTKIVKKKMMLGVVGFSLTRNQSAKERKPTSTARLNLRQPSEEPQEGRGGGKKVSELLHHHCQTSLRPPAHQLPYIATDTLLHILPLTSYYNNSGGRHACIPLTTKMRQKCTGSLGFLGEWNAIWETTQKYLQPRTHLQPMRIGMNTGTCI